MAVEPPAHLVIGTDITHLVEYDKASPISDFQEASCEASSLPETISTDPPKAAASPLKHKRTQSDIATKHIYRIEYIDNTGTVIAVKKGATPPAHKPDQGEDAPVFELIKRVMVFAKGSKNSDAEKKPTDGITPSARKEDKPASEKTDELDRTCPGKGTGHRRCQAMDFDISPETNTTWSLRIVSGHLMNALRAVVDYYPGLQLLSQDIQFNEPYKELIHHMEQLDEYKDNQPADHPPEYQATCREHIDELLNYLNHTFSEKLKEEYMRHKRDIPVRTFPYLWLLFKPGEEVYWNWGNSTALSSLFIVESVSGGVLAGTRASYGPEGRELSPRLQFRNCWKDRNIEVLQPFDGEKPIHELKMYPTRFYKEDSKKKGFVSLQEQLLRNGKAFFKFCKSGGHYMMLRGRPVGGKGQKPMVHGRVVVDMDQYWADRDMKPILMANGIHFGDESDDEDDTTARTGCRCVHCSKRQTGRNSTTSILKASNHQTTICFIVFDRKWELVHISDLQEIDFDEHLLESLVLPQEIKHAVQALAWNASQRAGDTYDDDNYIGEKGNGQIILLHGAPGVECVAELVKRPLISLTCGDLGTHVTTVEVTLKKYMSWGEIWNGVVLLDEADVYLESRTRGEVDRNALVSVFLRELERYQGIMFLTTNRIGTFDDAFLSRLHVGLLYKALSDNDREKRPPINVHRDAESYVTGNWKKEGVVQEDLINIKWNGREIRNGLWAVLNFKASFTFANIVSKALQTALALASYETNGAKKQGDAKREVVLRAEHIQSVVRMSKQFKIFINDTKKSGDEDTRARNDKLRGSADGVVTKESSSKSSFKSSTPSKRRNHSDD
ncbi:hypothetical protein DL98DRAFT_532071 [Cadophora sp. DSE1049]|nr:hypothetical protein DL98DRAFT_532071 [Cadophora sp. DSE1049]